ncbi:MAG: TonB-dependent receptor plug domain-containing protein, partial [Candidatus Poribacteria bacterium]|nr:TonB-dependent receptor plug domain-containing protein [Candidatus Poribacteria bacterium]
MNRLLIWTTLMVWGVTFSQSQEPETIRLSEIAVSATRIAKETFRTPNSISVIERQQIDRMSPTIMPQILSEVGGVFAQQTTVGQGSPVLRGLTGYQTSINIDGVRLNNSTFRSGPNQYLSTIAPHNLDRIKVLRGPGSMLYG